MKVLLIYRDKRRGGTSIEGIFETLQASGNENIEFDTWHYDDTKSLMSNMRALRSMRADIYHVTGDIYFVAIFLRGRKVLMTIHDIGAYKRFQGIKKWVYGKWWIAWPVRAASAVVTVSDYTKRDIEKILPGQTNKIRVIHNGYNAAFAFSPKSVTQGPPRILLVGTAIHKNIETVIRMAAHMSCTLVIIGKPSEEQKALLSQGNVAYELYTDISTDQLYEQYKLADTLIFISLHEGFGMPIIEAQAIGRPVVTTSLASIPEVAGEGAYYMKDPFDIAELTAIVNKLMSDVSYRNDMIEKGKQNAARFTLDAMVRKYQAVYQDLANSNSN